jgi:16S rRNA (adenine1518-N6/adenine1519-N6)-dimethyltransferase
MCPECGVVKEVNLTSPTQVQALLRQLKVEPSGALGQNFLIDVHIRDKIIDEADFTTDDVVVEIGPGLGVLTEVLARRARKLIAVEKDARLAGFLAGEFKGQEDVRIIHADILEMGLELFEQWGVTRVVSNLPYSVGSRILMELFALRYPPERLIVTVQLEVGERLVAGPGQGGRGLLGVWAQSVYDVEIRKVISPTCFWPPPKVKSAVVCLGRQALSEDAGRERFRHLTKEVFAFRRKQLGTILRRVTPAERRDHSVEVLTLLGIDPRIRPEMLTNEEWQALADHLMPGV